MPASSIFGVDEGAFATGGVATCRTGTGAGRGTDAAGALTEGV